MLKILIKLLFCLFIPNFIFALFSLLMSIFCDISYTWNDAVAYTSLFWIPFLCIYYKKTGIKVSFSIGKFSYFWLFISVIIGCVSFSLSMLANVIRNGEISANTNILLTSIVLITITPIVEELFYRKWIYHYLSKYSVSVFTIGLISSLLFYISHWLPFSEYLWFYRIDTLIMGIFLFLLYHRTKNIRYCIFAHIISNLIVQLV